MFIGLNFSIQTDRSRGVIYGQEYQDHSEFQLIVLICVISNKCRLQSQHQYFICKIVETEIWVADAVDDGGPSISKMSIFVNMGMIVTCSRCF